MQQIIKVATLYVYIYIFIEWNNNDKIEEKKKLVPVHVLAERLARQCRELSTVALLFTFSPPTEFEAT